MLTRQYVKTRFDYREINWHEKLIQCNSLKLNLAQPSTLLRNNVINLIIRKR